MTGKGWKDVLWQYRAGQISAAQVGLTLTTELNALETSYHRRYEPDEDMLARCAPDALRDFQVTTNCVLENLHHSRFFAAARKLEWADRQLKDIGRIIGIVRWHEKIKTRCEELYHHLECERLQRLKSGQMLWRIPACGEKLLAQGCYRAADFTTRVSEKMISAWTAESIDTERKKDLRQRIEDLASREPQIAKAALDSLARFIRDGKFDLANRLITELGDDVRPVPITSPQFITKLRATTVRAEMLANQIEHAYPPVSSNHCRKVENHGQSDA